LIPKIKYFCHFGTTLVDAHRLHSSLQKLEITKHRTGDVTINLALSCVTLHCTKYPRSRTVLLVGSQAVLFWRIIRYIVKPNVQNKIKQWGNCCNKYFGILLTQSMHEQRQIKDIRQ